MMNNKKSNSSGSFFKKRSRSFSEGRPSNHGQRSFGGRRKKPMRKQEVFNPADFVKKAVGTPKEEVFVKNSFKDFAIHEQIKKNILERGYEKPTPIQDQIIPHLLEEKDVVGSASTGTGKTAAFLIPLIDNVVQKKTERVLILAPTRELAEQIYTEFIIFKRGLPVYGALCIGGEHIVKQYKQLDRVPEFVIGTPGRLMDLQKRGKLDFSTFTTIVLDEFDTMLDMGFIHDVKHVMAALPSERHAVFFSATMPSKIERLIAEFLKNPVKVAVSSRPSSDNVNQEVVSLNGRNKFDVLCELLERKDFEKVLVFGKTKRDTHNLSMSLKRLNISAVAIHGDKSQDQRKRALKQFRTNKVKIMLATDVISRGLDIDNVTHVINYDLPQTFEDYVHRIGRTGRGGKTGTALTFVD